MNGKKKRSEGWVCLEEGFVREKNVVVVVGCRKV